MHQQESLYLQSYERCRIKLLEMEEREQKIAELFKLFLRRSLVYVEKSNPELSSCCHRIRSIANQYRASDFPLERMQAAIDKLSNEIMRLESSDHPSIAGSESAVALQKTPVLTAEDSTDGIREILKGISKFAPWKRASLKLIEGIDNHEFDEDPSILIRRVIDLISIKVQSLIDERHHLFQLVGFIQKNIPNDIMDLVDADEYTDERSAEHDRLMHGIDEDFHQLKSIVLDADDIKTIKGDVSLRFSSMLENFKKYHANEKQLIDKLKEQNSKFKSIFTSLLQKGHFQNPSHSSPMGNLETCAITGLPNESLYRKKLKSTLERTRPGQPPMTLLIFDTGNINEQIKSLGEVSANKILVVFVQEVSKHIRYSDFFARVGDNRFAILLMSCSGSDGLNVAKKILSHINSLSIKSGKAKTKINLSCGLTEITYGMTPEEAHDHASDNLKIALKQGVNRCVLRN